jgi:hypothetical protein
LIKKHHITSYFTSLELKVYILYWLFLVEIKCSFPLSYFAFQKVNVELANEM